METTVKTALGSLEDVKEVLALADVKTNSSLSGEIRILMRVLNSDKEDIILNSVRAGAEQITDNLINVNIHVPNLRNQPSGTPNTVDNTQPNLSRMEVISDVIIAVLDGYRGFDFFISLFSGGEVIPNEKDGFYYNLVFRYTFLRKDK